MSTVSLGSIKRPPKVTQFNGIKHIWTDEEAVGTAVKLDIPLVFSPNKTYLVFIRSFSGNVNIDGSEVSVKAINVLTNYINGTVLSGGAPFRIISNDGSFGISFPDYSAPGGPVVCILRPQETDAASLFNVVVYEL